MVENFLIMVLLCSVVCIYIDFSNKYDFLEKKYKRLNFKFKQLKNDFVKFNEKYINDSDILYDYISSIYEELEIEKYNKKEGK